eukprot:scaffold4457_cov169-Amphora_coffeaeformis.AAC.2
MKATCTAYPADTGECIYPSLLFEANSTTYSCPSARQRIIIVWAHEATSTYLDMSRILVVRTRNLNSQHWCSGRNGAHAHMYKSALSSRPGLPKWEICRLGGKPPRAAQRRRKVDVSKRSRYPVVVAAAVQP